MKIFFKGSDQLDVYGYSDSDWVGDTGDRKWTSVSLFMMAGGAISEFSRKHSVVATFTFEPEFSSLTVACSREAVWLGRLLMGIVNSCSGAIKTFSDSQNAINLP